MLALPKAVAQAAAVTAWTRAAVLHAVVPQRFVINWSSSPPLVMLDTGGTLFTPPPSTRAASGPADFPTLAPTGAAAAATGAKGKKKGAGERFKGLQAVGV